MTGRGNDWQVWAALLFALAAGVIIGWGVRVNYSKDRYIQALAERHEAERTYWSKKTDDIITNNTLETERRKKK